MTKPVILLAIDGHEERVALANELGAANCACQCVDQPTELLSQLEATQPATVIVDISFGGGDTPHLLRSSTLKLNGTPVVFRARRSASELELALEASLSGAGDFLLAPHDPQRLGQIIERAHSYYRQQRWGAGNVTPARGGTESEEIVDLNQLVVGSSQVMVEVRAKIRELADSNVSVLIHGEAGTGKERVASAIHRLSRSRTGPWIIVRPATIPLGEGERHLFGSRVSERGGNWQVYHGTFDEAADGTLFIDELGDLHWDTQLSLLRKLEVQSASPEETACDKNRVRVIAATSRDPADLVAEGRLREDLYNYLRPNSLILPPLRKRPGDIAELANQFLREASESHERGVEGFSDAALGALSEFLWPGNLDQLRDVIGKMVLATEGPLVGKDAIPCEARTHRTAHSRQTLAEPAPADLTPLQRQERLLIIDALAQTDDNVVDAARLLKMGQATVYRKIRIYQISHARRRRKSRPSQPR